MRPLTAFIVLLNSVVQDVPLRLPELVELLAPQAVVVPILPSPAGEDHGGGSGWGIWCGLSFVFMVAGGLMVNAGDPDEPHDTVGREGEPDNGNDGLIAVGMAVSIGGFGSAIATCPRAWAD